VLPKSEYIPRERRSWVNYSTKVFKWRQMFHIKVATGWIEGRGMGRNDARKIMTAGLHHIFSLSPLSASISMWTGWDLSR
jgi:hypothetical protein